ncbi:Eco29kI restriction endonuclease [Amycolatopsis marina]|uniref:Eco29kI restriction endonuclease n=1 Tax=Amycolatopsis marina TaxID=490629 RepID=A0A1I0VYN2_9PSEU|nr:Eco29kI family restriction endonuclease [Amycolatopsis marina]SFA81565.1 Eco29kI restriction endonuclease [Amycolatopsis marina]
MPSSGQFRLSITRALGDQLADGLANLEPDPLHLGYVTALEKRPGVYQLYEDDVLVYIGKAEKSLQDRLRKHHDKIAGRLNIGIITFTCLYVDEDLHAVAPETLLIKRYKKEGLASWNFNGFGSNDPGKARDETVFEDKHFDTQHPANLNLHCEGISAGTYKADRLLKELKASLPYVFRYEASPLHHELEIDVAEDDPIADHLFEDIARAIASADPSWQITALPGYVTMYRKQGRYPSARKTYPSTR